MDKKVTDLLYRSCQGALSDEEQKWLDEALARSEELRKEKKLIDAFFKTARSSREPSFAPFFDDRVMKKIKAGGDESSLLEPFLDSLEYAFRRVAVLASFSLWRSSFSISAAARPYLWRMHLAFRRRSWSMCLILFIF